MRLGVITVLSLGTELPLRRREEGLGFEVNSCAPCEQQREQPVKPRQGFLPQPPLGASRIIRGEGKVA